ncbi:MAG: L,D-transpeptidase family protein [Thermaerobacter sp.]|nr:L,D-transpeptidase family protein [Thermaerobacter sp.]
MIGPHFVRMVRNLVGLGAVALGLGTMPALVSRPVLATAAIRIVINVPSRTLYLYRGQSLLHHYPVAVGRSSTPTPRGEFVITQKAVWGDGFGTRWMRFSAPWGIYGIHGTNRPWSVGLAVSHGCVRMYNRNVEQLYALVSVGTPVVVEGPTPLVRIRRPLNPGAIGQDVVELQRLLRLAGVYPGALNGIYQASAEEAVRKFQLTVGMPVTGIASLETVRNLLAYTRSAGPSGYLTPAGRWAW